MAMLFEKMTGEGARLRAVFRSAQTNESVPLDAGQIERIMGGDLEEVHGEYFPAEELRRGLEALTGSR